ncbi:hypothetical protein L1049_014621 [Liquidambar formosana]|uniref:Uncharacterized protein n=1 Tax=Liquidambar formosana TaxID=63359 RepID=A0AAP0S3J8_LIQFO
MGNCKSCESTSVATAKLVLHDGQLEEFSNPVKVSHVLQKHPACFICNSDDMEFNGFVSAINGDEELQPGQLYFVLPMSWLRHPLQAEDMASLAVKASSSLMKSGKKRYGCSCKEVDQVAFTARIEVRPSQIVAAGSGGGGRGLVERRRLRSGGGGGGRRRTFTTNLNVVLEEEALIE